MGQLEVAKRVLEVQPRFVYSFRSPMQLESQCIRVQLQEYRGSKFVKGTSKQFRVYNCTTDDLLALVRTAVVAQAPKKKPTTTTSAPTVTTTAKQPPPTEPKARKPLSAEVRARIAAGQTRRWATIPNEQRKTSPATKQKIAESQRERWSRRRPNSSNWSEIQTRPLGNNLFVGVGE